MRSLRGCCCCCFYPPQVVRVADYDEQALVAGFKSWFGGVLCLDWSPDGRYIVTGGEVRNSKTSHTHAYIPYILARWPTSFT